MEPQAILRALEEGVTLVTATRRLAREWRRRYDAAQAAAGRTVWPSAEVLTLEAWTARACEAALDAGALGLATAPEAEPADAGADAAPAVLLSEAQAQAVWERIVARLPDESAVRGLLRPQAAAGQAREAWRRLVAWRLPVPEAGPEAPLEHRAFAAWARAYAETCAAEGWADPAHGPDRVRTALHAGWLEAPTRLLLAGFDDLTPQHAALFAALRDAGTEVVEVPPPQAHADSAPAVRVEAADAEAEVWAAAQWARRRLEAAPEARIAIVVPDLHARRAQLVRVLEDVLLPVAVLPGHTAPERPFNISRGLPLADYPLVATALHLLALTPAAQPLEQLSALLRSPFLAGAEREAAARARLDVRIRRWGAAALAPAALSGAAASEDAPDPTPALDAALGRWRRAHDALPGRQGPTAWAQAFADLLAAWGFPGERRLDGTEYQTLEKWHEVLEELARLALVAPRMTRSEALAALRRLAAETLFQPESGDAPVQVLGVLESGGLAFDHLWVLGLHAELWPPAPQPSPWLPLDVQRAHDMPRASLRRELEVAQRETARLQVAAPEVVFSHPCAEGERPLAPSPLIAGVPAVAVETLTGGEPAATLRDAVAAAAPVLETLADAQGPPIASGVRVHGGTGLFQDQAACPFRAFTHHRLHARAPEAPEPGLDACARGTLVHAALERLWARLGEQATLLALDDAALDGVLAETVDEAVAAFQEQHRHQMHPRLANLERTRLRGLLRDWLAVERGRAPFAVEQQEERRELEVGGITVTGRVDRIDRLPDGRQVLIDYKTGRASVGSWWGERPDEPQLPLYAVSGGYTLAGVAFAQVRRQELTFRGVQDADAPTAPPLIPNATRLERIPPPPAGEPPAALGDVVAGWRAALEGLAERFRTGDARVDPKQPPGTCQYCDLPGLCRIAEQRPAYALEDGPAAVPGEEGRDG